MKMKNSLVKIITVISAIVFVFSAASCEEFYNEIGRGCNRIEKELNDTMEKLVEKLKETIKSVDFIIENFAQLSNPLSENGMLAEEWVGTELDEIFVQPECVTELKTGYFEENEKGKTFSNVAVITDADGLDVFVQQLKENGYDTYKEELSWFFYSLMMINKNKVCIALEKDGVYIVIVYFTTEGDAPNAVFTISNYDTLAKDGTSGDGSSGEGGEEGGEGGETGSGEGGEEGGGSGE